MLDRLTGGMANQIMSNQQKIQSGIPQIATASGLRNDSYYMATNDTWSPVTKNNSVLIEDDSDPLAPYALFIKFIIFSSFSMFIIHRISFFFQNIQYGYIIESNK